MIVDGERRRCRHFEDPVQIEVSLGYLSHPGQGRLDAAGLLRRDQTQVPFRKDLFR